MTAVITCSVYSDSSDSSVQILYILWTLVLLNLIGGCRIYTGIETSVLVIIMHKLRENVSTHMVYFNMHPLDH